jgi:hypothetical protein
MITLSYSERQAIKNLIEETFDDYVFFGTFTLESYNASLPIYTQIGSPITEYYYSSPLYTAGSIGGWTTTPVACRAYSQGAGTETKADSTVYVQRMQFIVSADTSVVIPATSNYEQATLSAYLIVETGQWLCYNGIVYRIVGTTIKDSLSNALIIDAKQDAFSGDVDKGTTGVYSEGYLYAGSCIAANTTLPTQPKILMANDYPLGANGSYIRT